MSHWAFDYIGKSWEYGAGGPEAYDCWNFVRHIEKVHFNIDMPIIEYKSDWHIAAALLENHQERDFWCKVDIPKLGDIVMMARSRIPVHIGVWIDANATQGVLHCVQRIGVVFTKNADLRSNGWGALQYFHRKDN